MQQQKLNKTSLVDDLAAAAHLEYLSDMRQWQLFPLLLKQLQQTPAAAYPVQEWQDAVQYIFHTEVVFESPGAARQHLLAELQKRV